MDKRPKVLSIDDNAVNQKLVERVLGPHYQVRTALSGAAGLEAMVDFKPDLILLDIEMGQLDGFNICRMIRGEPEYADTPIIFVTCRRTEEDRMQCFQAGGNDFLAKPIDVKQLLSKIAFNLDRKVEREQASHDADVAEDSADSLNQLLLALLRLNSSDEVCIAMINALEQMQLMGAVHRHSDGRVFSSIGPLTDLENLLVQQATRPYPTDHSGRFLWGSHQFGVIIHNMPNPKSEAFNTQSQIVATMLTAADEKLDIIQRNHQKPESERNNFVDRFKKASQVPIKNTNMSIHGFKLECALEELERVSELHLYKMSSELKALAERPVRSDVEKRLFLEFSKRCEVAQLSILEHCKEIQTQYYRLMADAGFEEHSH